MAKKKCTYEAIERVPTGIGGLDKLMEGGFVKNSTIMIRGDTGNGKTLFCLQYLYKGAKDYDEPGVYISFSESTETICQHGTSFGWDLKELIKKDKLAIVRYEPHEIVGIIAQGGGSLRDVVEDMKAKRLVIDSLTAYEMVFENQYRANESVLNLFELLRKWDSTALVTSEVAVTPEHASGGRLGFLTDAIINLYHCRTDSTRKRAMEILKMRDTNHSDYLNEFEIGKNGLKITKLKRRGCHRRR
ncbi:hypothetical protein KKB44_02905 [Candidatus Micrarchaeota archaeon]|nr:hypothetical protein [Candidatus Micrarchaeota archaeon]